MQNTIDHIAEACHLAGITEVVICPGSRNAPLTIAFVRSGHFRCLSVPDERSAGFIALGKAIALQKTVVLLCTSGSAVVNFFPAVAEAFYQRIPLLVISADRPPELIDQWDGQTIRQLGVFGRHVKGSFATPDFYQDEKPFGKICREAIELAEEDIAGPVHINVPLREPLYPSPQHRYQVNMNRSEKPEVVPEETPVLPSLKGKKVLILRGFSRHKKELDTGGLAVYEDVVCGGKNEGGLSEQFFMAATRGNLVPDILLTEGGPVLPRTLKKWLRENPPKEHYHFAPDGDTADPFQTHPELVRGSLDNWLKTRAGEADHEYARVLSEKNRELERKHTEVLQNAGWSEFRVVYESLLSLPKEAVLHVANSMAVRYVSLCKPQRKGREIHGNRGTSGIDGCVSTALGFASMDDRPQYLFCGDIAFFYDSNAFWNPISRTPLKVILLNNSGGGIFRLIDGPAEQPELEEFFETRHDRTAGLLCQNLGVTYFCARNMLELKDGLGALQRTAGPVLLEVFTSPEENQLFFKQYKTLFNDIKISMGDH